MRDFLNQMILPLVCFFGLLSLDAYAANYYSVLGGVGFPALTNESTVVINNAQTNEYDADRTRRVEPLFGLSYERLLKHYYRGVLELNLGGRALFTDFGKVGGTQHPFSNSGSFDTLGYDFKARSISFLFTPELVYTKYRCQPFVLVGLGVSANDAYDYSEYTTPTSGSAAPVPVGFSNKWHAGFAYLVGFGLRMRLFSNKKFGLFAGVQYDWMDLGKAKLGSMPSQTSSSRLRIDHLKTQAVLFSLELKQGK